MVTSVFSVSQSGQTRPRESVDEGPQEVIQLVDVTVTVFPPLTVLFVYDIFSEPVPPVPTESKEAVAAVGEEVVEFDDIPAVPSNSKDALDASSEAVSMFEIPPVASETKDAFEYSVAVFALFRVMFA